jgi:hypothetical protein
MIGGGLVVALLMALWGVDANAQSSRVYQDVSAADIVRMLQRTGYPAKVSKDKRGEPKIESKTGKFRWFVGFYGCTKTGEKRCKSIQFYSGYKLANSVPLVMLNRWNKTKRYARGYRQGELGNIALIEMDVPFMGVTETTFRAQLAMFHRHNRQFRIWISSATK